MIHYQMSMNVLKTTEDAANLQLVPTYLAASIAPAIVYTPVMDLTAQVRSFTAVLRSEILLLDLILKLREFAFCFVAF